jgi:triacylglycerol lipase
MEASRAGAGGIDQGASLQAACAYLCNVSYDPPAEIPANVAKAPQIGSGGEWKCIWGPAYNKLDAGLAYVAKCADGSEAPAFIAVVIRGTDIYTDLCGAIEQLAWDLDLIQVQLPWQSSPAIKVAQGTLDAFNDITTIKDENGLALLPFLKRALAAPDAAKAQLVVTGHSLGGGLSTVLAPWLVKQLPGLADRVLPVTFGGPTAGNPGFASYFSGMFGTKALRYVNTLDVVPMAWHDLQLIPGIYDSDGGLAAPGEVDAFLVAVELFLTVEGYEYRQPTVGGANLSGGFDERWPSDWVKQAEHQHHPSTYLHLVDRVRPG